MLTCKVNLWLLVIKTEQLLWSNYVILYIICNLEKKMSSLKCLIEKQERRKILNWLENKLKKHLNLNNNKRKKMKRIMKILLKILNKNLTDLLMKNPQNNKTLYNKIKNK